MDNPNRMITKQDLADFYDTIFPYLGGMPDVMANKFNRSDLYSTSEKVVGQWYNGKPLYQKTVVVTDIPNNSMTQTAHGVANIETICKIDGVIHAKTTVATMSYNQLPRVQDNSTSSNIGLDVTHNVVQLKARGFDASAIMDVAYVTFQYTKTTDSAVDIGIDTDYSTTEKIVGTWLNGEMLYQKTVTAQFPTVTTDYKPETRLYDFTDLGIPSNAKIVYFDGVNEYGAPLNRAWNVRSFVDIAETTVAAPCYISHCLANNSTHQVVLQTNVLSMSNFYAYITVRYTKTS